VRVNGWPLSRSIRVVAVKAAFVSRAVQHFLELARKGLPKARFRTV
jgi:hypothetical protein